MNPQDKHIPDQKDVMSLLPHLKGFQDVHSTINSDFKVLLQITEQSADDAIKFETLCRSCIRSLFALIEADIYYYNLFDSYEGYNDKHAFFDRFKKTFKQICKTWNRQGLQEEYFATKLESLRELKVVRDKLIHPKSPEDIIAPSPELFNKINMVFEDYDSFILIIMSNFFISTTLPFKH
jgi:hypothetical protein